MGDSEYDNSYIYLAIFVIALIVIGIIILIIVLSNNNNTNDGNNGGNGGCDENVAARVKEENDAREQEINNKLDKIINNQDVIISNIFDSENDSSFDEEGNNSKSGSAKPIKRHRKKLESSFSETSSISSPTEQKFSSSSPSSPVAYKKKEKKVRFSDEFVDIDDVSSSTGSSLFSTPNDGKHKYTIAYESGTNSMEPSNINQFTSDMSEHAHVRVGNMMVKVVKDKKKDESRVVEIKEADDDDIIQSMNNPALQDEQLRDATPYQPEAVSSNFSSPETKTIYRPKSSSIPKPKNANK